MHDCMRIKWSVVDGDTVGPEDFLTFNVSGMKYETLRSTLERFPNTLLGKEVDRRCFFVESKNAYFLNRCRKSFEAILYYYQSGGILVRPMDVPLNKFEDEVLFYNLGSEVLFQLQNEEGFIVCGEKLETEAEQALSQENQNQTYQQKLWELFESPDSSTSARIVSLVSMCVIGISIIIFCMETLPMFRKKFKITLTNSSSSLPHQQAQVADHAQVFFSVVEMCCVIWFTTEYLLRFLASPSKWKFILSPLNSIDLFAILPYFVSLGISRDRNATPLSVLRVVRLVRVFRIFKLSRHSLSLQILGNTLKASLRELGMLMFFLALGVLVFSTALYHADYVESGPERTFRTIPDTFWYSLVTMTTVGYGDVFPSTRIGKIIGSLCALTGVLTLALPVPVIVSNFTYFYKRNQVQVKQKEKDKELQKKLSRVSEKGTK